MLHGQAENDRWPDDLGTDESRQSARGPFAAVRRFVARRFRGHGGAPSEPVAAVFAPRRPAPSTLPRYVAAAPLPVSSPVPLFDTRLAREVRALLATLGTSPGSVAAALEAAGVRAVPGNGDFAPLGLYLTAVVGSDPNVKAVRVQSGAVVIDLRAWWRPTVTVPLPGVMHEFKTAFDAGCYPSVLRDPFRPDGADHMPGADSDRSEFGNQ